MSIKKSNLKVGNIVKFESSIELTYWKVTHIHKLYYDVECIMVIKPPSSWTLYKGVLNNFTCHLLRNKLRGLSPKKHLA